MSYFVLRIKNCQKKRKAALNPPVATEVRLRSVGGDREETEIVAHFSACSGPRSQTGKLATGPGRPEHIEQISLVDKSSGYSSTDHSSNGKGSVERLISHRSLASHGEEAV